MNDLPHNLYRAAQVRELDRIAIEEFAVPGEVLMTRAGQAAFAALRAHWPDSRSIVVLCGTGNNGGDGYVVARLAREAGLDVTVLQLGDAARVGGAARLARDALLAAGAAVTPYAGQSLQGYDVVVDALLGTGLERPLEGLWRDAVAAIRGAPGHVLAIDIPTGLHADRGSVLGAAVKADLTITFIGVKQGLLTGQGLDACGTLLYDDLGVPGALFRRLVPAAVAGGALRLRRVLPPRARDSHKGCFGHVLVVGGEQGMSGAPRLAGEAAARCGAGLVSIATRAAHAAVLNLSCPELMVHGAEDAAALRPLFSRATVLAIGPGLGVGKWARCMLAACLESPLPKVMDADALTLLAQEPLRRDDWVLTPHPGEAARLLGVSSRDIQADRFHAVREIQERYGGVCVLKGAGTLIQGRGRATVVCTAGNPGMAAGGMGDVLTGVIAALLAQGLGPMAAACHGAILHARAGDRAAREGERGLLAGDLMSCLRHLVNE